MGLRGSDSHETSKPLQIFFFFLRVGRIAHQTETSLDNNKRIKKTYYTGTSYLMAFYCLIVFLMYYIFNKTLEMGL